MLFLCYFFQSFLLNILQALISHCTSWRLNEDHFQHSFGSALSKTIHDVNDTDLMPKVQKVLSSYNIGEREEARWAAMLASSSGPNRYLKPLTVFNLRDALLVGVAHYSLNPQFSTLYKYMNAISVPLTIYLSLRMINLRDALLIGTAHYSVNP